MVVSFWSSLQILWSSVGLRGLALGDIRLVGVQLLIGKVTMDENRKRVVKGKICMSLRHGKPVATRACSLDADRY